MVSTARAPYPDDAPPTREAWLEAHAADYGPAARDILATAFDLAQSAYAQGTTPQGEPLFRHALAVAAVIADLRLDVHAVAAALTAHVLETGAVDAKTLEEKLGADVLRLVQGVGRMDRIHRGGMDLTLKEADREPVSQAESLRKMLLAMAEDVRVVLIVLAEQVQLLRELVRRDHPARGRIAREAQEIFAPLANRLGIWQLKWELEDLALRILEPELYKRMARLLDERRLDREAYINRVIAILREELARAGITAEVTGRPKHIYSIWRKMRLKNLDFEQVYDVRAVRVLVEDVKDCYGALGVVHGLWQPIPGEFDDYIAHPKANDYRSLHTAVIGPEGKALEVQIRTHEMHRHAEFGVAAHWRYKEGIKARQDFDEKIAWLRQLLAWRDEVAASGADAAEWVEQFKTELFQDRVYVLTPQGKVIDLPRGATPLDFAYAVHTDLGHRCRGAKVDGHIVPLNYPLQNAQRVEILTARQGGPSRDWLSGGYLATARARAKVRQWFNAQHQDEHLAQGREILDRELARLGLSGVSQERLAQKFGHARLEDFLIALGRGEIRLAQLGEALRALGETPQRPPVPAAPRQTARRGGPADVLIEGVGSLPVTYGKCCHPLPPDPIVAYLSRGRGVVVHRRDCVNVAGLDGERSARLLGASWDTGSQALHPVELAVRADDRPGLLRDLLGVLAAEKMGVLATRSTTAGGLTDVGLTVEVRDAEQLDRLLAALSGVKGVRKAWRRL